MRKSFLDKRVPAGPDAAPPEVFLGAFGKHPGWDDHIDDIGLETELLVAAKRVLYTEGVGNIVDAGDWEQLDEAQRCKGFDHLFVWVSGEETVIGRMWSSRDGKGRTLYPMVVACHCRSLSVRWILDTLPGILAQVKNDCIAASSAADVISIINSRRVELQRLARDAAARRDEPSPPAIAQLARCKMMEPDQEGLVRLLYQIETEMPELAGGSGKTAAVGYERAHHIRAPLCADAVADSARLWIGFARERFGTATDIVLIFPLAASWVDIIVGAPSARQLFCMQASAKRIPLSTDIPYTIEDEFRTRARAIMQGEVSAGVSDLPSASAARLAEGAGKADGLAGAAASKTTWAFARGTTWLRRHWGKLLLAALLALAVLYFAFGARERRREPAPESRVPAVRSEAAPSSSDWRKLCEAYYYWLGGLAAELADARRRAVWSGDPQLGEVLTALDEPGVVLNPREIAGVAGADLLELAKSPPASATTGDIAARTSQALHTVERIQKLLAPDSWTPLGAIDALAKRYSQNGWDKVARQLATVVEKMKPGESASLAASADEVMRIGPHALAAMQKEDRLPAMAEEMGRTGDPVLAAFMAAVRAGLRDAGSIEAVEAELDQYLEAAAALNGFVEASWQSVDRDLLSEESGAYKIDQARLLLPDFKDWLEKARGCCKMDPDPRGPRDQWQGRIDQLADALAKLSAANVDDLHAALGTIRKRFDALWKPPAIEKNREELVSMAAELQEKIDGLGAEIESLTADRQEWFSYVKTNNEICDSPTLNAEWVRRRDELLAKASPASLSVEEFLVLRPTVERLKSGLRRIDELFARADEEWPQSSVRRLFADKAGQARERILLGVLSGAEWRDGAVVSDAAAENSFKEEYANWLKGLRELADCAGKIETGLDGCYMLDEQMPEAGGETIRRLFARCRENDLYGRQEDLREGLRAFESRVEEIAAIETSQDRNEAALRARESTGASAEVLVSLWRKAGTFPDWPGDAAELQTEAGLRQAVLDAIVGIGKKQSERGAAMRELLNMDGEGARRWRVCMARLTDKRAIEQAMDLMDELGVSEDELMPSERFNLVLYDFEKRCRQLREWAEFKQAAGSFLSTVASLGGDVAGDPRVTALSGELAGLTAADRRGSDLTQAGPALAGWIMRKLSDANDGVEYFAPGSEGKMRPLRFARVLPAESGRQTCYLCTTEVSVGLFVDTITGLGRENEVGGLLTDYDMVDPRKGPRSWERFGEGGGRVSLSENWLFFTQPDGLPYPAGSEPPRPTREHPMQYVSPRAAVYFCGLVGCRLPSVSEWQAAWESEASGSAGVLYNLRDASWGKLYRYAAELGEEGRLPDEDVFWPSDTPGESLQDGKGACVTAGDDGVMWFNEVSQGGGQVFKHLVGNVAEFAYGSLQGIEPEEEMSLEALREASNRKLDDVRVIGGSALSSPLVWDGSARSFGTSYPVRTSGAGADFARMGFADVGFRLAFTAPGEPLEEAVKRLFETRSWYLAGGS